ncbi:MAG: leucine-rich repeat domain-containing protein [Gammaproteobacteria bacterium]|nr:leucine-rich repeat domain-containing protein [Gammaproteobacteria bacterium]
MLKNPVKNVYLRRLSIAAVIVTLAGLSLTACGKSSKSASTESMCVAVTTKAGLSARAQDSAITLSWPQMSDAKKYNLYWSLTPGVTKNTGTKIADVSAPYLHTALTNGIPVYYIYTVETLAGEGAESLEIAMTPSATVSDAPGYQADFTYNRALGQDGQIELYWTGVANATSYNVYRKTSPGVTKGDVVRVDATSPAVFTGLQNNKTYYFAVTAIVNGVETSLSNEVVASPYVAETQKCTSGNKPEAPRHLYVYAGDQQTTLYLEDQEDHSDALRYTLYWNTSGNVTTADAQISNVAMPYTHTGLTNGNRYFYRIVAQNQHGESALAPEDAISNVPNNDTIASLVAAVPDANLQGCITDSATRYGWKYQRQFERLDCEDQKIINLAGLNKFSNLYWVDLTQTGGAAATITSIDTLKQLINLGVLGLSGDRVTNLSFLSGLTNLGWLDLSYNSITNNLDVPTSLHNLEYLYLNNNPIDDLVPLAGLTHLQVLQFSNNQVADLSTLTNLKQLRELYASGNLINDLNLAYLSGLTNLEVLELDSNPSITDISALAPLTNLNTLSLQFNSVVDVTPLSSLTQLIELRLFGNQIVNVSPLAGLTTLNFLHLGNNKIGGSNGIGGLDSLTALTQATYIGLGGNESTVSCTELDIIFTYFGSPPVDFDGNENTVETFTPTPGVNCR